MPTARWHLRELITARVKEALALIDVRLVDHLILPGRTYSASRNEGSYEPLKDRPRVLSASSSRSRRATSALLLRSRIIMISKRG